MDELQILVKAIIDENSEREMDSDLSDLAKKLGNAHKIKLKVALEDGSVKTVQSQLQAIAKKINTSTAGKGFQIKVFDSKKLQADGQKYFHGVKDIVSRAQKEFSKMGKVDITNVFKDAQGNIQSFSANVTKADGVVEKFNFELAKIKHTSKAFSGFVQTNSILSDKSAGTELEKTLNFLNRIDNKIADITSKTLVNTSKPLLADMEQYNQYQTKLTSVKRRIEEIKKANTTLSTDHKREIASMIADLQRYAGELQRSAYASTDLKAATFANKKAELQAALQTDIQKWTNAGIFGGDFEAAVNKAKKQLDDAVDSKDLDEYRHKLKLLIQDFKQLKLDNSASNQILNNDRLNTNLETARLRLQNLKKTYSSFVSDPNLSAQWEALFDSSYVVTTQKELTNLNAEIRQFEQRLISAGKHNRSFFDELKANAAKMGTWMILGGVLAGVMRGITGLSDAVIDLNTAMTELKKVTDETDEAYDAFLTSAADKAVEIGTSYSNLVTSTSSFARLGYTMEDAASLAEVANIYNVVGDEVGSIDEATNSIISTMKAFGIEAENAMTIVDKFNKIGNEFAISSGGIGSAMQRSASAMAAANNTIDQSIALMVAANNVIQDPDVVGTMWKTVSMRIRGAVTELEDAGLETEAMAESTASLQKQVKALTNVDGLGGFDIMADADNFKSTYDIILGISKVWKDMSDIDQAALLELLAGKRQGNALAAAITNMKDAVDVLEASVNAEGSAMEEHGRWMESIQAKQQVFQAQYEEFANTLLNSELFTLTYDAGTGILGFLTEIVDTLGAIPSLITALTPLFNKTFFKVTEFKDWGGSGTGISTFWNADKLQIEDDINLLNQYQKKLEGIGDVSDAATRRQQAWNDTIGYGSDRLKTMVKVSDDATLTTEAYTSAVKKSGSGLDLVAIKSKAAAVGVQVLNAALNMLLNMAISFAISTIISMITEAANSAREAREAVLETADAIYENAQNIEDAYVQFVKYAKIVDRTAEDENNLQLAIDALNEILGDNAIAFDAAKISAENYADALGNTVTEALYQAWIDAKKVSDAAMKDLAADTYGWTGSKISFAMNPYNTDEEYSTARQIVMNSFDYDLHKKYYSAGGTSAYDYQVQPQNWHQDQSDMNAVVEYYYELISIQDKLAEQDLMQNDIYNSITTTINKLKDGVDTYVKAKYNELKLEYEHQKGIPATVEEYYKFTDAIVAAAGVSWEFGDQLRALAYDDFGDSIHQVTESVTQATSETVDVSQQTISKFRGTVEALKQAVAEYSDTGEVTAATYQKVTALGEDYADLFDFTNGKIELQADELDTLAQKLVQEAGATLAANDATTDQIALISKLVSGLRKTEEETEDTLSTIKDLVGVLEDAKEGTELSTLAMLDLIMQYPDLADNIIETTNGYKLEEDAVWDLIEAKKEELKINELLAKQNAKNALLSGAGTEKTVSNVDAIFAKYGEQISSFEDYVTAWEAENSKKATGNWIDGYREYVEASIAELRYSSAIDKLIDDISSGSYRAGATKNNSSTKEIESEFEQAYKKHQHLLNMDQESVSDYLAWLNTAYQDAYAAGQIELDDYYKYQEEVYEKTQSLMQDSIGNLEHQIGLLSQHDGNDEEIINLYKELQEKVHEQAEYYRSLGLDENAKQIQELQNQWWDYYNTIRDTIVGTYEEIISESQNKIDLNETFLNDAVSIGDYEGVRNYSSAIISEYRKMQKTIQAEADYYRSLGYSETSNEVSKLTALWYEYRDNIIEAASAGFDELVENANTSLDEIQGFYDDLKNAAQEYAENGFITVDTFQQILSYGVQYLAMLQDENGQLVINEQNIQKIIAARTEQVAVESALNYIEQIRTALTEQNTAALNNLLYATEMATESTWDLVYAQLASLDLTGEQYDAASQRIETLRALTENAISGIGQELGQVAAEADAAFEEAKKQLQDTKDALDDILDYTIAMIKQEVENQIDALEDQIDSYQRIVDLQKESLALAREKDEYDSNVSEKSGDIADLQEQIAQLSLDDSREAQAEKVRLEEELAKKQKDLADYQSDYAYDKVVDSLDKMATAYEQEKQTEIEILQNSISSYQKLYDMAITRINTQWDTLYQDLIAWNYEYGNNTTQEITSAWSAASAAVQQYGSYLSAVASVQSQLNSMSSATSSRSYTTLGSSRTSGITSTSSSSRTTNATNTSTTSSLIAQMKKNSADWWNASETERKELASLNSQLASQLESQIGKDLVRGNDGVWYIGKVGSSELLYDIYHKGGIVGEKKDFKDDEKLALLQKGELVIPKDTTRSLLDVLRETTSPHTQLVNGMAKVRPTLSDAVESITNNNTTDNRDNSVKEITVNNEIHFDVKQKLDKEEINRCRKYIGEVSAEHITESFTKRGIKPTAQLF